MKFETKKSALLVATEDLGSVRRFYEDHFDFQVTFEHESYIGLRSRNGGAEIAFMPPGGDCSAFSGGGITLCLEVEDVDAQHARIVKEERVPELFPLKDNPWGDRSFAVLDPAGVAVYVYKTIAPSKEFEGCVKE